MVVFGCGGDRDRSKRPQMARIASQFCDHVFLTSDNPRSEDPKEILKEVRVVFRNHLRIILLLWIGPALFGRHF